MVHVTLSFVTVLSQFISFYLFFFSNIHAGVNTTYFILTTSLLNTLNSVNIYSRHIETLQPNYCIRLVT